MENDGIDVLLAAAALAVVADDEDEDDVDAYLASIIALHEGDKK